MHRHLRMDSAIANFCNSRVNYCTTNGRYASRIPFSIDLSCIYAHEPILIYTYKVGDSKQNSADEEEKKIVQITIHKFAFVHVVMPVSVNVFLFLLRLFRSNMPKQIEIDITHNRLQECESPGRVQIRSEQQRSHWDERNARARGSRMQFHCSVYVQTHHVQALAIPK